jgi:hypothetical protein
VQRFAVAASPEGKLPYPDGSIATWDAWTYHPLEESGKAFGRRQSFVYTQPPTQQRIASYQTFSLRVSSVLSTCFTHQLLLTEPNLPMIRHKQVLEPHRVRHKRG